MTDRALRSAERGAVVDLENTLRWALASWRLGDHHGAISALLKGMPADPEQLHPTLKDLLLALSPTQRRGYGKSLAALVACDVVGSLELLKLSVPSFSRVRGNQELASQLCADICRAALSREAVRLASRSNDDQAIVAACIHDIRGGLGFLVNRNVSCPSEEYRARESFLAKNSWSTVFVYDLSESHFSRIEDRLTSLCERSGAKLIYGIRLDAWDGDQFGPFAGLELTLPSIDTKVVGSGQELFSALIHENQRERARREQKIDPRVGQSFAQILTKASRAVQKHRSKLQPG